jgi:uncharacterized MAPEG superfamily protein
MEYVYLVIVLALIEFVVFGILVARARGKYGVEAPAITGNEIFERTFRVHQNTLEGLIVFLPALWIFGTFVSSSVAAAIGALWIIGRAIYANGYIAAAEKRGPGAVICGLSNIVLLLGSLYGVIRALV